MAPEVISEAPITYAADIWSLGIILNDMLKNNNYKQDSQTPFIRSLISDMLEKDPRKRITAKDAKLRLLESFDKNILCPHCR
jgi:serine/threonine protein kinase